MDRFVASKDGTLIAHTRDGAGPPIVLVGGGLDDGTENTPLVPELSRSFTMYNYARRGRGGSGDTPPYSLEREIEDLDAVITVAGGSAHLYGVSSGGGLALEAAAAGLPVGRIAVYEVPYCVAPDTLSRAQDFVAGLGPLLAQDRRGDTIAHFMRFAGASEEDIEQGRNHPMWAASEALAHTLAYDTACMANYDLPTERFATIRQPTLVATGSQPNPVMNALPPDFFERAADAIAACVPQAERHTFAGEGHVADPAAVAPVLRRFFTV